MERAATWNGWGEEEKLLQLAGYLKGKALQEMMSECDRSSFSMAATKLKQKLDQGAKKLADQDFCHATQKQKESVSNLIHHLEKFRQAYGREALLQKLETLCYTASCIEGLRVEIMQAPAVSGAQSYAEPCVAAKNAQHRQDELYKRQAYSNSTGKTERTTHSPQPGTGSRPPTNNNSGTNQENAKRCFICNKVGHLKRECRQGNQVEGRPRPPRTNQVRFRQQQPPQSTPMEQDLQAFLESSSDEEVVHQVRVKDTGSQTQCVKLSVQVVPVYDVIDIGSDITIIGGKLFKRVVLAARLKKRDFMKLVIRHQGYMTKSHLYLMREWTWKYSLRIRQCVLLSI